MKTIIKKFSGSAYKVNGKLIRYNERAAKWQPVDELSVTELYDFHKFIRYGQLDRNRLQMKLTTRKFRVLKK